MRTLALALLVLALPGAALAEDAAPPEKPAAPAKPEAPKGGDAGADGSLAVTAVRSSASPYSTGVTLTDTSRR